MAAIAVNPLSIQNSNDRIFFPAMVPFCIILPGKTKHVCDAYRRIIDTLGWHKYKMQTAMSQTHAHSTNRDIHVWFEGVSVSPLLHHDHYLAKKYFTGCAALVDYQ